MIFHRFVEEGLRHFSYAVGDESNEIAVIVDPRRDANVYIEWIQNQGLELAGVIETHIHADYVSGARELANQCNVPHYLSSYDQGNKYVAGYEHTPVENGDLIKFGSLRFQAIHTPGPTPEHFSYLLFEGPLRKSKPKKLFSGDFLFVESLGSPDVPVENGNQSLKEMLYKSVQKIKKSDWPDDLEIHPTHEAGILGGAEQNESAYSTLSKERKNNPYLKLDDINNFTEKVSKFLPDFPPYHPKIRKINKQGPSFILPLDLPEALSIDEFNQGLSQEGKNIILDLRNQKPFAKGHIPGSYNLCLSPKTNRWIPWILDYDAPIFMIGSKNFKVSDYDQAYQSLLRVGLDDVQGYLEGGFHTWKNNKEYIQTLREYNSQELNRELRRETPPLLIDVRTEGEFRESHIPGAINIMISQLPDSFDEIPDDRRRSIITVSSSGYRSALAGSILLRKGYEEIGHLSGGFAQWCRSGFDSESWSNRQ